MPFKVVDIRFSATENQQVKTWNAIKQKYEYKAKDVIRPASYLNHLTNQYGEAMATVYFRKIRELLDRNNKTVRGKYNSVGATNAARDNYFIKPGTFRAGLTTWTVEEGDFASENYYIRHGFKGHGDSNGPPPESSGGESPVIKRLRLWAAAKGIALKLDKEARQKAAPNVQYRQGRRKKEYGAAKKGEKTEVDIVLMLIRRKIWAFGSEFSNWDPLPPSGSGRFDVISEAYRQSYSDLTAILGSIRDDTAEVYIDWLTGRKKTGAGRILRKYLTRT